MLEYVKFSLKAGVIAAFVGAAGIVGAQESETSCASLWAKPISNPIYTDLALQKREVNLIYAYQNLPTQVELASGAHVPLDGDIRTMHIQAEIPVMENLSIVANKAGWIDYNTGDDALGLDSHQGLSDLSGGLKWSFYQDEKVAAALRGTVEIPIGNNEVFQGNGRGSASPALLLTHLGESYVVNGLLGAEVPFDSSERSTMGYAAASFGYRFTQRLAGLLEINWFRVLESGHGEAAFSDVPNLDNAVSFEGGDLINFGAPKSEIHRDFVSGAIGARCQINPCTHLGVSYEIPLTTEDQGVMDERVTVDFGYTF